MMLHSIHYLAALGLVGLCLIACHPKPSVTDNLRQRIQSGANEIDMNSVATGFQWDGVFVFGPYTPHDQMCKDTRLSGKQCSKIDVENVDEGEFLLVFVNERELSRVEHFPRMVADFDEGKKCSGKLIVRKDAVFSVRRDPRVYLMCR